jgi:hypothetical protein
LIERELAVNRMDVGIKNQKDNQKIFPDGKTAEGSIMNVKSLALFEAARSSPCEAS